jgi:hypothetical protein
LIVPGASAPAFLVNVMSNDYVYDLETYPNVFTMAVEHAEHPLKWMFEISPWRNDSRQIIEFLNYLRSTNARMVGFNNLGFDYPILHTLYRMGQSDARTLYNKAQAIILSQDEDEKWAHMVKPDDRIVPQIDLYKIHHFDNKARATGLKALEFNMRMDNISDLPFPVGADLNREQIAVLKDYNQHDVSATKRFLHESLDLIKFREELMFKHPGRDWLNFNDTKIGKVYFEMKLEEAGVPCYSYGSEGRTPRQTPRPLIALKDAILPWVQFEQPEFNRVLAWLKAQVITETKGVFTDLSATVNGFTFVFGLGGIHGSVENEVIESDDEQVIVDLDVSSYYPNLAICNRFYPEHLGTEFCDIYKHLYEMRKQYPKGTAENAMLKLALNGTYGDSNNRFSVFYDPLFTMSITLNGQLLLCMLAEGLMTIPGLRILQANTDGISVYLRRDQEWLLDSLSDHWSKQTGLTLEKNKYRIMAIADVNSYIVEYED